MERKDDWEKVNQTKKLAEVSLYLKFHLGLSVNCSLPGTLRS